MIAGVGTDLVEIARVERMIRDRGDRLLKRLFTPAEIAYATIRARPAIHLAARLAAKESAFKALAGSAEARLIGWTDIEIVPRQGHPPTLLFHGRADARIRELAVLHIWLSITHTETMASAIVVLERA